MRTISPSELTDWTFCQKYHFHKRKLGLVNRKISHRDLAAMMGTTVGYIMDCTYNPVREKRGQFAEDYFWNLVKEQRSLGRTWDYGIEEETLDRVIGKIQSHINTLMAHEDQWLEGATVIASEPVMKEWGLARQDLVVETKTGIGRVIDFKCKYSDKATSFATSRDVDLYGNQAMLYPIAWNSQGFPLKITQMRFVYVVEYKPPIVEDVICNPKRQAKWLEMYDEACRQIYHHEEHLEAPLLENPYHMTPWGPCEFREYCNSGEHSQGVLNEFIQVERKEKS